MNSSCRYIYKVPGVNFNIIKIRLQRIVLYCIRKLLSSSIGFKAINNFCSRFSVKPMTV